MRILDADELLEWLTMMRSASTVNAERARAKWRDAKTVSIALEIAQFGTEIDVLDVVIQQINRMIKEVD